MTALPGITPGSYSVERENQEEDKLLLSPFFETSRYTFSGRDS